MIYDNKRVYRYTLRYRYIIPRKAPIVASFPTQILKLPHFRKPRTSADKRSYNMSAPAALPHIGTPQAICNHKGNKNFSNSIRNVVAMSGFLGTFAVMTACAILAHVKVSKLTYCLTVTWRDTQHNWEACKRQNRFPSSNLGRSAS